MSAAHSRHYAPYLGRMRPLPGAADLLRTTARLGLDVVLATSAKDDEVDLMLDALGARSAIRAVVSSGDVDRAKPDPGIVTKALDESGVYLRRTVMVGDTVWECLPRNVRASATSACSPAVSPRSNCGLLAPPRYIATQPRCSATFTPAR